MIDIAVDFVTNAIWQTTKADYVTNAIYMQTTKGDYVINAFNGRQQRLFMLAVLSTVDGKGLSYIKRYLRSLMTLDSND